MLVASLLILNYSTTMSSNFCSLITDPYDKCFWQTWCW